MTALPADPPTDPVVWRLAAADADALLAQLDRLAEDHDPAHRTIVPPTDDGAPARLGLVDPDERKIRLARRLLAAGEPWRGRSDIWFTPAGLAQRHEGRPPGRVAFLFPGVEPTFDAAPLEVNDLAGRLALAAPELSDDTLAHRSASIYRLGIFLDVVLRELGIEPDVMAGHSLGEWSGTVASGMIRRDQASGLLGGLDLGAIELPEVDFAALSAGVDAIAEVVAAVEGVVVSHDNSPRQSVVCGPAAALDEALDRLRDIGILGYKLAFRSGFHTPFVEPLLGAFRTHLDSLQFEPPATPLWSATLVGPYPDDPAAVPDLHLRHLVEPVRFRPLVERLYHEAGVRIFVQVGLGSLTGFVDDTLRDLDHASVTLLSSKRTAWAQLQRALTALWVEGVAGAGGVDGVGTVGVVADATPTSRPAPRPVGTRPDALAAAADLLAAAAQAGHDVLAALAARLEAVPVPVPPVSEPADPEPTAPAVPAADGHRPWPQGKVVLTRRLSLETMPETLDHTLFNQPAGWADDGDRFPIVAMTTQIQLLQDIAAAYGGGRPVVEVFGVRNLRWLDLASPQDVDVTIVPKGDDVLSLALGGYCRANLRFGRFEPAPRYDERPLTNPRPTRHTAQEMFEHRVMFHGPRFQGITALGPAGDDGILGDFHNLATPGSLLDNLGKLVAYWVIDQRSLGESPLPIGVDRIRLFGPLPAPGIGLRCDVRIVELQESLVRADGVIVRPDGSLWCRVEGWTSHVFHLDPIMEPIYRATSRHYAAEPQPGGWSVVVERWPTGAGRDLTARRFLARAEREVYEQLNLLEQRRWLIDVVAAKDAVRRWLAETFGIPSFPVEIGLVPEGERRYRAVSRLIPPGHDARVTVSSLPWLAVAIVGDGEYRDIEAREVPDGASAAAQAGAAAAAVRERNPDADVASVTTVEAITPSTIEVVVVPRFAVAWTASDRLVGADA